MNWLDTLRAADVALFHWINYSCSNAVFDALMPWFREKWIWTPFYVFILTFCWLNFGKKGWLIVLGLVAVVGLTDFTSSELIKKNVGRLRPCNDVELQPAAILRLESCGSGYSFTSSHAANHFAAATFLIGIFGALSRWVRPVLLGWAALIAFSQVYVGVHFPGDVMVGGLVGALIGWGMGKLLGPLFAIRARGQ